MDTDTHAISMDYSWIQSIRKKIKIEKQLNQLSLKILFGSKQGQDFLFEYIKQTGIATRKNMLQNN